MNQKPSPISVNEIRAMELRGRRDIVDPSSIPVSRAYLVDAFQKYDPGARIAHKIAAEYHKA